MIDLKTLQPEQLQDPALFAEVQASVIEGIQDGEAATVKDFRLKMKEFMHVFADLEKSEPALMSNYRKLNLYIELQLFEFMPEDIQVRLLERHFFSFARIGLNVLEKIAFALLLHYEELENEKKETLVAAMLNNQELIDNMPLTIDGKQEKSTVGNWIRKYRAAYGIKEQDSLVRIDFSSRGDARNLSEEGRKRLQLVLDAYETLKATQEETEFAAEEVQAVQQPTRSPLYIPSKRSLVPLSEVRRALAPTRGGVSAQPASTPAATHTTTTVVTEDAETFQKLSDIAHVSLRMIEKTGISLAQFVSTVKTEVARVSASNPQAKYEVTELWRQSPLYFLYMDMAHESMNTKKPISQVVQERSAQGRPVLTKEQFDQVSDLSRSIQ